MDLLSFQYKKYGRIPQSCSLKPPDVISVHRQGGLFRVNDMNAAVYLSRMGRYGHTLGERQNNVNPDVFSSLPSGADNNWGGMRIGECSLELSLEEIYYLFYVKKSICVYENEQVVSSEDLWMFLKTQGGGTSFYKKMAVYNKLRNIGWCVRSGLTYGCQYLLYKECPNNYHASAGVFIENDISPNHFVALTRALTNVKKAVILATAEFSPDFNDATPDSIGNITIEFVTSTTFFPERIDNMETI